MVEESGREEVDIYYTTKQINLISIHLNKGLGLPYLYNNLSQSLRSTSEEDEVSMHINGEGGGLSALHSIISAMSDCPAKITGYLDGEAQSAHSAIFLHCDDWVLNENSTMMIHAATGGSGGHIASLVSSVDFMKEQNKRFMFNTYSGFLTENEIETLINGAPDMFLFPEEILKRLGNLVEYRNNLQQEENVCKDD